MSLAAGRVHSGLTILGCFGAGSLYGWSGYMPAVRAQFAVSNALASMVFSLALVSFTVGVLLGPYFLKRMSSRYRLALLAVLAVLALSGAGASAGFGTFVASYGVCFGLICGALYNHALATASFTASATLLIPISVASFGLGGAVFGPVQFWLNTSGWSLWSHAPVLVCFVFVALLAFFAGSSFTSETVEQTPAKRMILPDKTIVVLGVIFAAGSSSGLIVIGFASQILPRGADGLGLTSLAIFLSAIGNTLGRLSSALSAGWFGPARAIAGAMVATLITLGSLIFAATPILVVGLLFFVAFGYGQLAASMPLLVKSQVEASTFSASFGWVFVGWGVAGLIGPWSAGWLMDSTGTLKASLLICIVLAALSFWLVLGFSKTDRPQEDS
ncbi:hypothetical protein [Planktotalea sp.]|uniref:hypothetical protein n=1 Tax=Planktotalea sp. TaxID=2029877 RepID=UPI0025EA6021|nr:hypothetical protein [Planktotalea sp.]